MCSQHQMHTVHACIQCTEHSVVVVVDRFYISRSYTFEQRERERGGGGGEREREREREINNSARTLSTLQSV